MNKSCRQTRYSAPHPSAPYQSLGDDIATQVMQVTRGANVVQLEVSSRDRTLHMPNRLAMALILTLL